MQFNYIALDIACMHGIRIARLYSYDLFAERKNKEVEAKRLDLEMKEEQHRHEEEMKDKEIEEKSTMLKLLQAKLQLLTEGSGENTHSYNLYI